MHLRGFGAIAPSCGPNSVMNPLKKECYCEPGFTAIDSNDYNKGCKPVDVSEPCGWPDQQRSPIDKLCTCPPGTALDPAAVGTRCLPVRWFPSCVDVKGQRVPNCILGYRATTVLPIAVGGVVAGVVLASIARAIFN